MSTTQEAKKRSPIISESRTARIFNNNFINPKISARVDEIRTILHPFTEAQKALDAGKEPQLDAAGKPVVGEDKQKQFVDLSDARRKELTDLLANSSEKRLQLNAELSGLQNARIRFAESSGALLRDIIVVWINEMLQHTMQQCQTVDKKIINVSHLHSGDTENLVTFPLVRNLPSWVNPPEAPKKGAKAAESDAPAAPPSEDDNEKRPSLVYYITEMAAELTHPVVYNDDFTPRTQTVTSKDKDGNERSSEQVVKQQDGEFAALRTSTHIKEHISNLVLEFFARLSPLVQNHLRSRKVKTITEQVILDVIENIMNDGLPTTEELVYSREDRPDPEAVKRLKDERRVEREKAKTENREPRALKSDDDLPKVSVQVVTKKLNVEGDRFQKLMDLIAAEKAKYPAAPPKADSEVAAE